MTSKEFNEKLILEFPEISLDFYNYIKEYDGKETGSFLVVEDVFMPYFYKILEKNNVKLINKICDYIEQIYLLNDDYASNVIVVGILENLKSSNYATYITQFLKPFSLKEFNEIQL